MHDFTWGKGRGLSRRVVTRGDTAGCESGNSCVYRYLVLRLFSLLVGEQMKGAVLCVPVKQQTGVGGKMCEMLHVRVFPRGQQCLRSARHGTREIA